MSRKKYLRLIFQFFPPVNPRVCFSSEGEAEIEKQFWRLKEGKKSEILALYTIFFQPDMDILSTRTRARTKEFASLNFRFMGLIQISYPILRMSRPKSKPLTMMMLKIVNKLPFLRILLHQMPKNIFHSLQYMLK